MIELSMEMEQYDCPFIDTTADHDVTFSTFQWEFDQRSRELETRLVVEATDRGALDSGLEVLRDHPTMHEYTLLKRWEDVAHIHTVVDETDAMETIRANNGYIRGQFYVADGSELWHIGFDSGDQVDKTLSDLERNNEFVVLSRRRDKMSKVQEVVRKADSAKELIDGCQSLSEVERETVIAAVENGYFESPRQATLGDLADEFDISKPALSKNLRRGQQKVLERIADVLQDIDNP